MLMLAKPMIGQRPDHIAIANGVAVGMRDDPRQLRLQLLQSSNLLLHLLQLLALVSEGVCVLRYDNEAGKGDHRHVGAIEAPYMFNGIDQLLADFLADVERWLDDNAQD